MNDLVFVSAQPDIPYFHWQVKIYVHNFIEKGISPDKIHILFLMINDLTPSQESLKFKELGVNVYHYRDTRKSKVYIPTLRPLILSNWLRENPQYSKSYFYHDSDIIFRVLPDFDNLLNDDICYLSDTKIYIDYEYLRLCSEKYKNKYPFLDTNDLINKMCEIIGVTPEIVKTNQESSGGAQYLLKNVDYTFWEKVLVDCENLYIMLHNYEQMFPIKYGVQIWTSDMWSVLWNLWLSDKKTKISDELSFSWGSDLISVYDERPILHMAGVTEDLKNNKFYKGDFITKDPIQLLKSDSRYFDYISDDSATKKYVEVMKTIIKNEHNDYLL